MVGTVAVILNYNEAAATLDCVRSVIGSATVSGVVVVDNASEDVDRKLLSTGLDVLGGQIALLKSEANLGFGGGMNLGVAEALSRSADSVLLLNNDTIVGHGAIEALRRGLFAEESIGVAIPVVTTGDGETVASAGGWTDPSTLKTVAHAAGRRVTDLGPEAACNFAPGAALLVRPSVFLSVGGFAEKLFLYVEDVELSLRISAAGFSMKLVQDAVVWHAIQAGNATRSARSVYFRVRNSLWLARSRSSGLGGLLLLCIVLARGVRTGVQVVRDRPSLGLSAIRNVLEGAWHGLITRSPDAMLVPTTFDSGSDAKESPTRLQ